MNKIKKLINEEVRMAKIRRLKSKKVDIVAQSNSLIDAPKDLSLLEYKLFLLVVSKIDPKCDEIPVFSISAEEFSKVIGIQNNSSVYRDLKKIADKLMTRVAHVYDPIRNVTINVNLTRKSFYWHDQGKIEIHLSNDVKPFLLHLQKEFTQYKLSNINHLSSLYAIRLYELLKKHELLGKRIFKLQDFRQKLGIFKNQYSRFADLKKRVLDIALREINEKTDLIVEYELRKERQKFVAIKFDISSKSTGSYYLPLEEQTPVASVKKIMNLGYSFLKATDILSESDPRTVENAINAVEEQIGNSNAKNSKAMLQTAIKQNWKPNSAGRETEKNTTQKKKKAPAKTGNSFFSLERILSSFRKK